MNRNYNAIATALSCIGAAVAVGYAWACNRKTKTVEAELETKVNKMLESGAIDIRQSIVDDAVTAGIERRVGGYLDAAIKRSCDKTADKCVMKINDAISTRARDVVDDEFAKASEKARIEINKQICDIDVAGLKHEVREAAIRDMRAKLDHSMDDILDKFNGNLDNTSKIYASIANHIENRT